MKRLTLLLGFLLAACGEEEPEGPTCGPVGDYLGSYVRDQVISDPTKRCPGWWLEGMLPTREYEGWKTCITIRDGGCTQSWHFCPPAEMSISATVAGVLTWEGHKRLSGQVAVFFAKGLQGEEATCLYQATYEQRL